MEAIKEKVRGYPYVEFNTTRISVAYDSDADRLVFSLSDLASIPLGMILEMDKKRGRGESFVSANDALEEIKNLFDRILIELSLFFKEAEPQCKDYILGNKNGEINGSIH